ncbi:MAG: hypothetical protein H0X40_04645 [Chthoniobacterales bacterium]|nr:hypothetical protein [Chthoniobacterales bacterium]
MLNLIGRVHNGPNPLFLVAMANLVLPLEISFHASSLFFCGFLFGWDLVLTSRLCGPLFGRRRGAVTYPLFGEEALPVLFVADR